MLPSGLSTAAAHYRLCGCQHMRVNGTAVTTHPRAAGTLGARHHTRKDRKIPSCTQWAPWVGMRSFGDMTQATIINEMVVESRALVGNESIIAKGYKNLTKSADTMFPRSSSIDRISKGTTLSRCWRLTT